MAYKLRYAETAVEDLAGMDRADARALMDRLDGILINPWPEAETVTGEQGNLQRIRAGENRAITSIDPEKKTVLVLSAGRSRAVS